MIVAANSTSGPNSTSGQCCDTKQHFRSSTNSTSGQCCDNRPNHPHSTNTSMISLSAYSWPLEGSGVFAVPATLTEIPGTADHLSTCPLMDLNTCPLMDISTCPMMDLHACVLPQHNHIWCKLDTTCKMCPAVSSSAWVASKQATLVGFKAIHTKVLQRHCTEYCFLFKTLC
jgi:hypothetical protein